MAQFIEFDPIKQPKAKVELHAHLDGSVQLATIWELAEKKRINLHVNTLEDLFAACSIKRPSTLAEFLKPFSIFVPVIAGDKAAIERIAYEFCEETAKQGVLYSETRYCPQLFCTSNIDGDGASESLTPSEVVECVNRGLQLGCAHFNIIVKSILCCFRRNPEWSEDILQLCLQYRDTGVVGIDVAGDEAIGLASPEIVATFQRAEEAGVHRTVHAGEAGPASNVYTAITDMRAERIGHGYHVVDDPDIYADCLNRKVHFETCPFSSILTGSVSRSSIKHPIVRFAEDNANFSISRDDPTLIQKTLDQEYDFLRGFGLKDVHFARANFQAARASFLPDDEKKQLLEKLYKIYGVY